MTEFPSMIATQESISVALVVMGEGRGHMTQALALSAHLRKAGHRITGVFVGTSKFRPIPSYFIEEIGAPVETFEGGTIVPDARRQGMSRWRTLTHSIFHIPAFLRSMVFLRARIRALKPDVVVNFYELLWGLSHIVSPRTPPRVAVAHNYLIDHPGAARAPSGLSGRLGLTALSWCTGLGTRERLALSFDALPPHGSLTPVPPLLRPGLSDLQVEDGEFLLAYALNPGYARVLAEWQRTHPEVELHCYVEGGESALKEAPGANFFLHRLHATAFLKHLAGCRAYVGTAGFEATCEAFYLGKPVLTIPVEGQYEQRFNALDAERSGAARAGSYDDLDAFWRNPQPPDPQRVKCFRKWVDSAAAVIVQKIEDTLA